MGDIFNLRVNARPELFVRPAVLAISRSSKGLIPEEMCETSQ